MAYRAYVGNIPFSFTKQDLEGLFQGLGTVKSAEIISDRETGRSRGFGFVELETNEQLQAAIQALHGKPVGGRNLTVNEARERAAGGGFGGPRGPGGPPRSGGPSGGPTRTFGGPPPVGGAPHQGPGPDRGEVKRERDRVERKPRLDDDYNRNDKRWKRGGEDWE